MRDYVITVNSTVDVPKLWLEERHVPVVALKYTIDGETYTDMEGLTPKEFLWQTQRRKDVCDVPGESGRGERDVRAVCERRKGCTASEFFFGAERNCQ